MDRLMPWLRRSGWMYALIAVVLAVMAWRSMGGGDDPAASASSSAYASGSGSGPASGPGPASASGAAGGSSAEVRRGPDIPKVTLVHVAGEVRKPGVYRMGGDTRVIQAVRVAGGPTRDADLTHLNLAAPLADGQQVVVPARPRAGVAGAGGGGTAGAGGAGASGAGSGPVSLSSATAADLEALDGVGPALAARIIAWRDSHGGFSSVDALDEVPGIGPARMEALRPHLTP